MQEVAFSNHGIEIAAHLYLPEGFDAAKQYPALVSVHPAGGVKEQVAGLYAKRLAEHGYVALAYDSSYQGASGGEPRQLENPSIRVDDVSAAIDFLVRQDFVDAERIGLIGICAGGGYSVAAAMSDRRVKALGVVSTVNIGDGFRFGWDGHGSPSTSGLIEQLETASARRTAQARGGDVEYFLLVPHTTDGVELPDMREAVEYYRTERAMHPNASSTTPVSDLMQLMRFDAFHLCEVLLTQPLMIIAGTQADTLWYSEALNRRAASTDKTLHLIEGAGHIALYDKDAEKAIERLVPFYDARL